MYERLFVRDFSRHTKHSLRFISWLMNSRSMGHKIGYGCIRAALCLAWPLLSSLLALSSIIEQSFHILHNVDGILCRSWHRSLPQCSFTSISIHWFLKKSTRRAPLAFISLYLMNNMHRNQWILGMIWGILWNINKQMNICFFQKSRSFSCSNSNVYIYNAHTSSFISIGSSSIEISYPFPMRAFDTIEPEANGELTHFHLRRARMCVCAVYKFAH